MPDAEERDDAELQRLAELAVAAVAGHQEVAAEDADDRVARRVRTVIDAIRAAR